MLFSWVSYSDLLKYTLFIYTACVSCLSEICPGDSIQNTNPLLETRCIFFGNISKNYCNLHSLMLTHHHFCFLCTPYLHDLQNFKSSSCWSSLSSDTSLIGCIGTISSVFLVEGSQLFSFTYKI